PEATAAPKLSDAGPSTQIGDRHAHTWTIRPARSKARERGGGRGVFEASRPTRPEGNDHAALVRAPARQELVRDLRFVQRRSWPSGALERTNRRGAHGAGAESVHGGAGDRAVGCAGSQAAALIDDRSQRKTGRNGGFERGFGPFRSTAGDGSSGSGGRRGGRRRRIRPP